MDEFEYIDYYICNIPYKIPLQWFSHTIIYGISFMYVSQQSKSVKLINCGISFINVCVQHNLVKFTNNGISFTSV